MLLHGAIRILISNKTHFIYDEQTKLLLTQFISNYLTLYGPEFITYYIYNLIHLTDYVKIHGLLDKLSVFRFEIFLQNIKRK